MPLPRQERVPPRSTAPSAPSGGQRGWVGHWLDVEIDWEHIAALVEESYRMTALERLIAQITGRTAR